MKDMYIAAQTTVETSIGQTKNSPVTVDQGSELSPYLFNIVINVPI